MFSMTLTNIACTISILLIGSISFGSLWRLFLSPIAHIPGPKLAALTYWYEFYYDAFLPGQYIFKVKELHKRYGKLALTVLM